MKMQKKCDCIFLGNIVNFIDKDFDGYKVFMWDENPYLKGKWYNLGDVRSWSTVSMDILYKDTKVKYQKILKNLDEKYNLVPADQMSGTILRFLQIGNYKEDKLELNVCVKVNKKGNYYNIYTRGFSNDYRRGRLGNEKEIGNDIVVLDGQINVLDGYFGVLNFGAYSTSVLRDYECDGAIYKSKVTNPYIYHYVTFGDECKRVSCVYYDKKTREAHFMLTSDFAYVPRKLVCEVGKGLDVDLCSGNLSLVDF